MMFYVIIFCVKTVEKQVSLGDHKCSSRDVTDLREETQEEKIYIKLYR